MTGEHQNADDDFLDDFVLDEGFDPESTPAPAREMSGPAASPVSGVVKGDATVDEDDLLFTDHTQGLSASQEFAVGSFDEAGSSTWSGDTLDLDEAGVPTDSEDGTAVETGLHPVDTQAAEAEFSAELDELLTAEEDFGVDGDEELEIVGGADAAAATDGDVFVIEDTEALAEDGELAATDVRSEVETADEPVVDFFGNVGAEAGAQHAEEGWEPLPGARIDDLAEVDGVELVDEGQAAAAAEDGADFSEDEDAGYADDPIYGDGAAADADEPMAEGAEPAHLVAVGADVEGHDIYGEATEAPTPVLVGAYQRRGRVFGMVSGLAAALAILAIGGLAVSRPEWFGLRYEPSHVEVAQVARPRVQIEVPTPAMPVVAPTAAPGQAGTQQGTVADPTPVSPVAPATAPEQPGDVQPPTPPTAVEQVGVATPPQPSVPDVPPEVPAPTSSNPSTDLWPVAVAPSTPPPTEPTAPMLTRVNDSLLIGELVGEAARQGVDGVAAGARAFAQLANGNYFIGSVKAADARFLTLRIAEGEVSLPRREIVRLAQLGTSDYDELQKATSGFVRLTNSNRLVGSILSSIADDHVVLETKSNRVMLPKSAIEEIVKTEAEGSVRVTTTLDEDEWLRQVSRRQIGGRTTPPQAPAGQATPAAPAGRGGNRN